MIMTMMTKMTQMQNQMQVLMQAVLENQVSKQNLQQNPTVNPPQQHSTKPEPITPTFSSSQTPALTPTLEIQQQLFLAIRCGDLAKTSQIVQSTPNWWELEDENGNIAFMKACCYPDSKVFIVSYLIEQTKNNRVQAVILSGGMSCQNVHSITQNVAGGVTHYTSCYTVENAKYRSDYTK
jgi:hypothetical protein